MIRMLMCTGASLCVCVCMRVCARARARAHMLCVSMDTILFSINIKINPVAILVAHVKAAFVV